MHKKKRTMAMLPLLMLLMLASAASAGDLTGYCSDESIPQDSSYNQSLQLTLSDLVKYTATAPNMTYKTQHGDATVTAYGEAMCFRPLTRDSCNLCIRDIVAQSSYQCSDAIAVTLTYTNRCTIRYQDNPLDQGI